MRVAFFKYDYKERPRASEKVFVPSLVPFLLWHIAIVLSSIEKQSMLVFTFFEEELFVVFFTLLQKELCIMFFTFLQEVVVTMIAVVGSLIMFSVTLNDWMTDTPDCPIL